ncbi:hypothetical protein F0562_019778 [Nyssa sinensis]|uniref:Uncharacterized protein n=1 Tax=Nyssa sinensis TaxID=561372 RepID=A0A5J5BPV9_9ASTE|nr:hypothetical protein F0562_019778 [Nyssa sinensis]
MATLGEIRYESHDLKAQLQLQLKSFIEAANKIEELKKRLEETEMELGTSRSSIDELKGQSKLSIVETATSEVETRHCSEMEVAKVTAIDEQKDKILKFGRKLTSDGYNLCLKKFANAYPKIDIEVLDHIKVFDVESGDLKMTKIQKI